MKIDFIASDRLTELTVPSPVPVAQDIPDWYKENPRFFGEKNNPEFMNGKVINNSLKACIPFYDAITSGYIQKTWCDIHLNFDYKNGNLMDFQYNYSKKPEIISHRDSPVSLKTFDDIHRVEFVWKIPWLPILPKGWSALFVHPLNRIDLPFISLSGLIDSDKFFHSGYGNYPFYVKKGFNNRIIPAGTPMYQIIPIKRESWNSKIKIISDDQRTINLSKNLTHFFGTYKRLFHEKKRYE